MAKGSGHHLRERLVGTAPGTSTLSARIERTRSMAEATMFGDVPVAVRLQMELVARSTATPAAALPDVIALLVPGDAARRVAIVAAISSNDPLREQWERTWEVLRR